MNPVPASTSKQRGCLSNSSARNSPMSDSSPYFGRRLLSSSVALCRNRWWAASFTKDLRWPGWAIPNLALVRPSCASPSASRYEAHCTSRLLSSASSVALGNSLARLLSRGCIIGASTCQVGWCEPGKHAGLRIPLPPKKGRLCLGPWLCAQHGQVLVFHSFSSSASSNACVDSNEPPRSEVGLPPVFLPTKHEPSETPPLPPRRCS